MIRTLHLLSCAAAFGLAWFSHTEIAAPANHYVTAGFAAGGLIALLFAVFPRNADKTIVRLGWLTWNRRDFCRGWLVTGDTGTGKTTRALNNLMYQIFSRTNQTGAVSASTTRITDQ